MTAPAFDARPSAFLLADNMRRMLGLKGPAMLQRLLAVETLREEIDAILLDRLGPQPPLDPDAQDIQRFLCTQQPDQIRKLSCVIAVLSQSAAARVVLHGPTLAAYSAMCPGGQILAFMRKSDLPACSALPPLRVASTEALELCSHLAERLLFGLLPEGLLVRIAGKRTPETFPMPLALPDAQARGTFLALARAGLVYLHQQGGGDATVAAS